ncbi:NUDIX domain-containing protein [Paraburkholderia sp. UCT70]|uniref:NUDIX domain-containing protein n=1 Tax=Paraburkholderia sp. UCT70 TaxID=2991068 RepID=UPI003D1A41CA
MIDVRGALIEDDRVLLVRERSTGRWASPGGFAEIGLSAAENVQKEFLEEACVKVVATNLYSMRHRAKGPFNPDPRDFL